MAFKDREAYNAYMREYHAEQYKKVRENWITRLGGKCAVCGALQNLEIDHIDRKTKAVEISKIWAYSKEKIEEELIKCQLLCKDCHSHKSIVERDMIPAKGTHGTLSSGRYCSCSECKAAKSAYNKEYSKMRRRKPK